MASGESLKSGMMVIMEESLLISQKTEFRNLKKLSI